jgi:hypothetical protein
MASATLTAVRSKFPQYGSIPDAELVQMLGRKYPTYLDRDPDFRSEFEAQTVQQAVADESAASPSPVPEPTLLEGAKQVVGSFGRAAAGSVAGFVALPGRLAEAQDVALQRLGVGSGRNPDGYYSPRLAAAITEVADRILPAPDERQQDSFWRTDVPSALGSVGGMFATGGTASLLRGGLAKAGMTTLLAPAASTAVATGTLTGFGAELEDSLQRATERGDNPDLALAKSLGYATVATLIENKLGAGRLLRRYFPEAEQAAAKLTAWGISKAIGKDILAGYAEEASQRVAQNAIVDETLDPEKLGAGANREGLAGAVVEGLVGAPGNFSRRRGKPAAAPVPAPEGKTEADYTSGGRAVPKPTTGVSEGGDSDQTVRIEFDTDGGKTGVLEVDGMSKDAALERLRLIRGANVPVRSVMVVPKAAPAQTQAAAAAGTNQGDLPAQAAPGDLEESLQAGREAKAVEDRYDRAPGEMRDYSMSMQAEDDTGGLIRAVADLGGIKIPEDVWGKGEYDDLRQLLSPESGLPPKSRQKLNRAINRDGTGRGMDQVLQELPEAGFPGISSAEDLVAALSDEARQGNRVDLTSEELANYWNDTVSTRRGRGVAKDGGQRVAVDDLQQGDRFQVMGRTVEVAGVNEDGTVDVEEVQGLSRDEGRGFWKRQQLFPGGVLFPDRGTFKPAATESAVADEPFSMAPDNQPNLKLGMPAADVADVVRRLAPGLKVSIEERHPTVARARGVLRKDGTIALFHGVLGSRGEVRRVLIEELGHLVARDPEGRRLVDALSAALTPSEIEETRRAGYGDDVLAEEAVMQRVVEADRGRQSESALVRAWRDLKAWLRRWLADRGWTGRIEDADVRELLRMALRAGKVGSALTKASSRMARASAEQRDADYLDAVKRGDMASARRMAEAEAAAAGFTGSVWHGSTGPRVRFEPGKPAFFSKSKAFAEKFLGGQPNVGEFALKVRNMFDPGKVTAAQWADFRAAMKADRRDVAVMEGGVRNRKWAFLEVPSVLAWMKRSGFDAFPTSDEGADNIGVLDGATQAKAIDAVTRDDSGNVIPLSKRFRSESPDVRFSLASDDARIPERVRSSVAPKPTSTTRSLVKRWLDVMPGFQGGKYQMAEEAVAAIHDLYPTAVREQIDTIVDYFGGGGFWGAFLGLTSFPNAKRLVVMERNELRSGKIRLYHENGDRVAALFDVPEAKQLFADAMALAEDATSGTAFGDRVEVLAKDRRAELPEAVFQLAGAVVDSAKMNARGRAEDEVGELTAEATFEKVKRLVIRDAVEAFKGAQALRSRGVQIDVVTADSYKAANPAPGPRTVAVMDPPYYLTTGYNGKIVRLGTYQQTAAKLLALKAEGNGIVYTDSAWWIDAPKRVSEKPEIAEELNSTGDLFSGGSGAMPANVAALQSIDQSVDQPYTVGLKAAGQHNKSRHEILGVKVPVAVEVQRDGPTSANPDSQSGGEGVLGDAGLRRDRPGARGGSDAVAVGAEAQGGEAARPVRGGGEAGGPGAVSVPVPAGGEAAAVIQSQPAPAAPVVPSSPPSDHYFDKSGQPRSAEWIRTFHTVIDAVRGLLRDGVKWFTEATAQMVRRFGDGVRAWMPAAWQAARQAEDQAERGVTGDGQSDINRILRHAELSEEISNREGSGVPVYDPEKVEGLLDQMGLRRPSEALRKFGGSALLKAKQKLDLTTAYQQAAVRRQSDELVRRVEESLDPASKTSPFPAWFRRGWLARRERMREFLRLALPISAHLNVTGRDAGGWVFEAFDMRAGFMPESQARRDGLQEGDTVARVGLDGSMEALKVGPKFTLDDGRTGHQLLRSMPADRQAQVYAWAVEQFPELQWFFDLYVDPAAKGMRQTINGVEVPVFNRWALATKYAEADPSFTTREAYTPDVAMSQGMVGTALRYLREKKLNPRAGTTSPGRKYDTGAAREMGNVQDLITGFNTRAFQVLQETARKEWMGSLLGAAADVPNADLANVPAGWVVIDKAMADLWEAFKRMKGFDDPLNFPQVTDRLGGPESPEFKRFFGEVLRLRGQPKMIPRPVVEALVRQTAAVQQAGFLGRLVKNMSGRWPSLQTAYDNATKSGTGAAVAALIDKGGQYWSQQYRAGLLLAPGTFFRNYITNPFLSLAAAHRQFTLALVRGGDRLAMREGLALMRNAATNAVPFLRPILNLNDNRLFRKVVDDVFPDEVFASGGIQDVLQESGGAVDEAVSLWRTGRRLAAAGLVMSRPGTSLLKALRYDKIDAIAKQQWCWSLLKAKAEEEAHRAGLRGKAARTFVEGYVAKPPESVRLRLIESANRWLLNYDDVPDSKLTRFLKHPVASFFLPFWRYAYLTLARETDQATRYFRAWPNWQKMSRAERSAAVADTISWWTLPVATGVAAAVAGAVGGDDGEEDKLIGTASVMVQEADGTWVSKNLPRELVTANRINLSYMLRGVGVNTGEDDWWLYVKGLPLFQSALVMKAATRDFGKAGLRSGIASGFGGLKDMLVDQFSVNAVPKIALKMAVEAGNQGSRPLPSPIDPYAAGVPLDAYVTLQILGMIPGQRQANGVISLLDPYDRRITQSKALGYEPGVIEALKLGGWTGLADRLARGGESDLPPKGKVDRRSGTVEPSRPRSLAELLGSAAGQNLKPVNRSQYDEAMAGQE